MMAEQADRKRTQHRAGLAVGLAGMMVDGWFFTAIGEAPFTSLRNLLYAVPGALIFAIPLSIMLAISWKWPGTGGILLMAASLVVALVLGPVWGLLAVWPVTLLPFISGVLFLLSSRGGD